MKNEMMKKITDEHAELRRWIRLDRGHAGKLMLDTSNGNVWADTFLSENDWKVYHSDTIITIPINDILYKVTAKKDGILTIAEEDKAIYEWCLHAIKPLDNLIGEELNFDELDKEMVERGFHSELDSGLDFDKVAENGTIYYTANAVDVSGVCNVEDRVKIEFKVTIEHGDDEVATATYVKILNISVA